MDIKKAVGVYHRNLLIAIEALLAVFIAIPMIVKTPDIIKNQVLFL